jgi:hypothetical protein
VGLPSVLSSLLEQTRRVMIDPTELVHSLSRLVSDDGRHRPSLLASPFSSEGLARRGFTALAAHGAAV